MNRIYIEWELLFRMFHGSVNPEEEAEFRQWYDLNPKHREYYSKMCREWQFDEEERYKSDIPRLIREFDALMDSQKRKRNISIRKIMRYAAIFILLIGAGLAVLLPGGKEPEMHPISGEIVPGGEKAILILSDGQRIDVGKLAEAETVSTGKIVVTKKDGMIACEDSDMEVEQIIYNTILIPRGGEHKLLLPDGSRVWLNSETSLTFPVGGKGQGARSVRLSGEAFFDIFPDPEKPFTVHTDLGDITVHGTQFNVKYYPDKCNIKATLVEGSISYAVPGRTGEIKIEPGYQLNYRRGDSEPTIRKVKLSNEIGWKSNMLNFERQPLSEIMESLARWYDIEVVFETDDIKKMTFSGSVSRYENFHSFTELFEASADIAFEIQGKYVTVRKK